MNLSRQDELFIAEAAFEAAKSEVMMKHGCVAVVKQKFYAIE